MSNIAHNSVRPIQTLALVALLALLGACSSLPTDFDKPVSHVLEDTSQSELSQTVQPLLERNPGKSGFRTLGTGEAAFIARLRLIQSAEQSLDIQYYIWHDDLTGRTLFNQLLAAADRGVRVRILLDDLDTAGKDEILRTIDAHPKVEIRVYNPFANRDNRVRDFAGDTRRINRRMHNKTLTADNIVTIFGGRNIGDEYFAAATDVGFGDMDALAIGPIADEVSAQFDLYWNSAWAYPITAFDWEEPVTAADFAAFRANSDQFLEEVRVSDYAEVIRQFDEATLATIDEIDWVWSEWLLAYDQPSKVTARKVAADTHLAPKIKMGMDRTQRDLIIVSPYFVPGEEFTDYLVSLVDRGVRVRILTNSLQANDVSLVHAGYMRYRKPLVRGGVELYEYKADANKTVRKQREDQRDKNRIGASRASLHAKFFGFDETYLFIGSFNLDGRSVALNSELGAYYASPEEALALSEFFDQAAYDIAYRVHLDGDDKLEWVTMRDGREIHLDREPDTSWWKRFSTGLLRYIVPESQL
ncbi:phospholipase D family protein [Seongchinamella sediminis]|uniref:phospholipase D family protein n=1 Tax=Seongchinamella sediminis TaxID=2283635 RepID=UPI001058BFA0|nr:phospholipase D family protein [Seongchinamella sediminis]